MKKFLALILALSLIISLAACGKEDDSEVSIAPPAVQYSEAAAPVEEPAKESADAEDPDEQPDGHSAEITTPADHVEEVTAQDSLDETVAETESDNAVVSATAEAPEIVPDNSTFEVHYIDVGQADAALVMCDGKSMLIDGGNSEDSRLIYSYLKNRNVKHLDYIIATHAHEDHVGGLSGALNYATAGTAYSPVTSYESKAFSSFVKYLNNQGKSITVPSARHSFKLGSADVTILAPVKSYDDPNNTSIVLRIKYGETSFLFTGDAEREAEQDILDKKYNLASTVLKVGHHGSDTSTTYPFLREIMPKYAVISVGNGNSYGHPTDATLSRLRDADVKVFRTDMQGTVICKSDGKTVSFAVEKNPDADTLSATVKPKQATSATPQPAPKATSPEPAKKSGTDYVLNISPSSMKFHYPSCKSVAKMKESNKEYFTGTREAVIARGFSPCGNCHP